MASRTRQKEEARARRLAEERARAEKERRERRLRMIGGAVLVAIAVVVAAVIVSTSGGGSSAPPPNSPAAKKIAATVNASLAGIPQSATTLGSPSAKVTITEYGDLECPVCKDFALGAAKQLIANEVRSGKVKLVFQPLETATGNGPNSSWWVPQQAAAVAAGKQDLAWNYIMLFYNLQGDETSPYVNDSYLNDLAKLVPGLDYNTWFSDRTSSTLTAQTRAQSTSDTNTIGAETNGNIGTPTLVAQGPKGATQPVQGDLPYGDVQQLISSVS